MTRPMSQPDRQPDRQQGGRIELRIDRVVLDSIVTGAHELDQFRAGLEAELARLLTEHGLDGATSRHDRRAERAADAVDLRDRSVTQGAATVAQEIYRRIAGGAP